MGFYYFSFLSWMAFAIYFAIVATIIVAICKRNNLSQGWRYGMLTVAFIAPWTEELWITYNFGQLCRKDAGKFIYKTVEVEGYFRTTGTRLPPESLYRFVEFPDNSGKFLRIEHATPTEKEQALKWYATEFHGTRPESSKGEWIKHLASEQTEVAVELDTGHSWRISKLDKPTARYHYTHPENHSPVKYGITKNEYLVVDSETGEVMGRQTSYGRKAYWFFIHLGAPSLLCPAPGERPDEERTGMLYESVLKPAAAK